jgi:hypothetical protein
MSDDSTESGCQHEAARLLPWFVTGTLPEEERSVVKDHLAGCPQCRADETREQRMRAVIAADAAVEYAPQPGLQKLLSRIEEFDRALPCAARQKGARAQSAPPRDSRLIRWLVAAVVVQAVGLGAAFQHVELASCARCQWCAALARGLRTRDERRRGCDDSQIDRCKRRGRAVRGWCLHAGSRGERRGGRCRSGAVACRAGRAVCRATDPVNAQTK